MCVQFHYVKYLEWRETLHSIKSKLHTLLVFNMPSQPVLQALILGPVRMVRL